MKERNRIVKLAIQVTERLEVVLHEWSILTLTDNMISSLFIV